MALTGLIGCVMTEGDPDKLDYDDTKGAPGGKAESPWPQDSASIFANNLNYTLSALPTSGQAQNIPWASSYWPMYQDNINYRWAGASTDSPAKKYEKAFGGTGIENKVSAFVGIDQFKTSRRACNADSDCTSLKDGSACAKRVGQTAGVCIPTWYGICPAWTAASMLAQEAKNPVTRNGVTFKVNDIKALVSLVHYNVNTRFVSLRCEQSDPSSDTPSVPDIQVDGYGRPTQPSVNCRDTNPMTYHVLLANYLGIMKQPFAEDRTMDYEVWNQPIRGYNVVEQRTVTAQEANRLIGVFTGGTTANDSGTLAASAWKHIAPYTITGGSAVKVVMTGSGDADLYVRFGSQPTASSYDCRPYTDGTNETCELVAPASATKVYVSVNGYAASSTFSLVTTYGGSTPTTYQFNPNAKAWTYMKTDVKYIGESSSNTDGNLAANIDQYTHTDRYEYILELDAAGKLIGGEWVGTSKMAHPDFLWLPINATSTEVAGIKYADVMSLLQESIGGSTGGGTTGERVVTQAATLTSGTWKQYGPFNLASGKTLTATMTGTGDADLYVRKGTAPSLTAYDCRPYKDGSAESCSIVGPAAVYVGVNGYAASSNFSLEIRYTEGSGTPPPTPTPTFTHLNTSGSVAAGEMKMFQLPIPAGKKVVIRTTSTNDIDLYIQLGAAPTTDAYLMRAYTSSGNETITYTATANGTLFIGVDGYEAGSFTLKTSDS